ncbi:20897_t:CDS:2 [Entrophospora sp. SA101]|nr:20897_t:CDS:2 [Entrophospora sp. SA101]
MPKFDDFEPPITIKRKMTSDHDTDDANEALRNEHLFITTHFSKFGKTFSGKYFPLDYEEREIQFYFVMPPECFDGMKKQPFHTRKGENSKRLPPWIKDKVKQYVLNVDLASNYKS